MKTRLLSLALWSVATALGASGCYRTAQSEIGQGRSYHSGQAEFDRFFDATHALQVKISAAHTELADARQNLTSAVAAANDANSSVLAQRIKTELDRVARGGSYVRVEFVTPASLEPSATRVVLTPAVKPRGADANLIRQVESSVTRMLRVDASMKLARQELTALATTASELEASLDRAFPHGGAQRDEAILNLHDAERAITLMLGSADAAQKPTADFIGKLAVALGAPWRAPSAEPGGEQRLVRASGKSGEPVHSAEPARSPGASSGSSKPASSLAPVTRAEFEP